MMKLIISNNPIIRIENHCWNFLVQTFVKFAFTSKFMGGQWYPIKQYICNFEVIASVPRWSPRREKRRCSETSFPNFYCKRNTRREEPDLPRQPLKMVTIINRCHAKMNNPSFLLDIVTVNDSVRDTRNREYFDEAIAKWCPICGFLDESEINGRKKIQFYQLCREFCNEN